MSEQGNNDSRDVPADWSVAALLAAGATIVSDVFQDEQCVALRVVPPISDDAYASALAQLEAGNPA